MKDEIWIARYEQLNERSRWYTSQLWYVPFAYIALVGIGIEKVSALTGKTRGFGFAVLSLLSFGTFVHVLSVKYFERRAVRAMQKLETLSGETASGGGSKWFLSFSTYLTIIPLVAAYAFAWKATGVEIIASPYNWVVRSIALAVIAVLTVMVIVHNRKRTQQVLADIRTVSPQAGVKPEAA
jgi:hypothetical protein